MDDFLTAMKAGFGDPGARSAVAKQVAKEGGKPEWFADINALINRAHATYNDMYERINQTGYSPDILGNAEEVANAAKDIRDHALSFHECLKTHGLDTDWIADAIADATYDLGKRLGDEE